MHQNKFDRRTSAPLPMPAGIVPGARRNRGRTAWQAGAAAEEAAARHYRAKGATIRAQRLRTPEGEIDLVVQFPGLLVFVEVKRRRSSSLPDSPVTERQWQRLESAALRCMVDFQNETGIQPVCRFDVVLAGPEGQLRIIENARSFDEH